jgi:iron(III) transport system ATP-binding protein
MQVTFENISQSYGPQPLFEDLQLTLPSGKFFTLLGPSGCGKTTLLRMLAGFVRPDRGRVLFGGEDVTAIPVHRRGIGMVFQDYALFPDRSVLANVGYGLLARNMPREQVREKSLAMLQRVGLEAHADRSPHELSGGQRQRVAMARALVIDPKLLLLDEPLSALDVKLRVELRGMVRALQQEAGITTVFVTHDQEEALAMSDLIAVMDRGRVVQLGSPSEVYARPRTAFAADFVGSANLIPVSSELPAVDGMRRVVASDGSVLYASQDGQACGPGMKLAVRSEEIVIREPGPQAEGVLPGIVETAEFRGSITGYTVRTGVGNIRVDAWSVQQQRQHAAGDPVSLHLPAHAHLVTTA